MLSWGWKTRGARGVDDTNYHPAPHLIELFSKLGYRLRNGSAQYYLGQAEKRGIRLGFAPGTRLAKRLGGTVRLTYADGSDSPRRWLHTGDGVLAQGMVDVILGYASWPVSIEIEWANGQKQTIPVRSETYEYVVP